jgi:O-antigen/teichoic acid export membrane protein
MQRKFLTNLILLLFLNLLVKPFWIFGIDRTVQNVVGAEDYGFYFTIFNFAFLFNILLDAGITNFNNRNIAQNQHLLKKHFSGIILLKFLLATLYFTIIFIAALIIGYDAEQLKFLIWIGLNNFLLSFILYLRSNISGLMMFRTDSIISVLDRVLMIIICGILLWGPFDGGVFRIEWFVYAQTAAYILTLLFALVIVIKKSAFKRPNWNTPFFVMILKKSFPFAILVLLMTIYNRVDSVFIERLLQGEVGFRQSGIFAMGYRLLDAANQLAMLFGVLLLPIFSRMIKRQERLDQMVRLPFDILFSFAMIAAIGSFFYRFEIMNLLYYQYTDESAADFALRLEQAADVFGIIMFGYIGTTLMYVFSTLLTANGNLKQMNIIAAVGILLNFLVNLTLVPTLLAKGAAWASLSTQLLTGTAYMIMAQAIFKFRVNYTYLGKLFIYAVAVAGMGYLSTVLPVHWMMGLLILIVFSLVLSSLLRFLSIRRFMAIIKKPDQVV